MYPADVLELAFRRCSLNGDAAGVDGERFEDIEAYEVEQWLGELTEELREKVRWESAMKERERRRLERA